MNSPDKSYSKVVINRKSNPGYSSEVHVDIRVANTLKNVQRSSWDSYFGMEAGMEYEPPTATGFSYGWGGDDEETTVTYDWHIQKIVENKELPPKTFAKWHAFKKPQTVTIPYTATIVPTFSVKLEGYMKWGGGYHGATTNFHQDHRGSGDREEVEHSFRSAHKPFYEDLKDQLEQNMHPWHAMACYEAKISLRTIVHRSAEKKKDFYAFTMEGQFEDTTENEIKSYWYPTKPIVEMEEEEMANLTAQADQVQKFSGFPRIFPPAPKVKIIDNSMEMEIPPVKNFDDHDEAEPEPTVFPRIHPPAPTVKPIDNSKEMKPLPVEENDE